MLSQLEYNVLTKIRSKTLFQQALRDFKQENYALSANLFFYLISLYPDFNQAKFKLAIAQMQIQFWPGAQEQFEALLNRKDPDILCNLGICHWKQNQLKQALRYFNYNLAHFPHHLETQENLAALYLQFERISQAIGLYQNILNYKPNHHEIRFNLATCLQQQHNYVDAIYEYRKILITLPKHFNSLYNLAYLHFQLKAYQPAKFYWEACLKLQPNNLELRFWNKYLQQQPFDTPEHESYVKTIFDNYASFYDKHLTQTLDYQLPLLFEHYFQQHFSAQQFTHSLDLGCGTGLCGKSIKPFSKTLIGVDLSAQMLKKAQALDIYNELHQFPILDFFRHQNRNFDLIILGDVLPYIKDLRTLLQEIEHYLRPQGHLIFSSELTNSSKQELQASLRFAFHPQYIQEICQEMQLTIINITEIKVREQNHAPVIAALYHWQKTRLPIKREVQA